MILDPKLTKAIADLDAAAKRLVKATAPACIDCGEPCGPSDHFCAMCKVKRDQDEQRLVMFERYSGCFDLIDGEGT